MSLILEALRKSEAERRRGQVPDLHGELPAAPAMRRAPPQAWWWVGALLAAVALVIAGVDVWRTAPPAGTPVTRMAPAPSISHASAALPRVERLSPVPAPTPARPAVVARPSPVDESVNTRAPSATASAAASQTRPAAIAAPVSLPPAPTHPAPVDDTSALSDLSVDERKALPPLKLSMHMWNDDPSQRFVILDGNRLREGDRIGDAVVTAITTDGVVLDWNGRKLKLPIR